MKKYESVATAMQQAQSRPSASIGSFPLVATGGERIITLYKAHVLLGSSVVKLGRKKLNVVSGFFRPARDPDNRVGDPITVTAWTAAECSLAVVLSSGMYLKLRT